ncbi:MAG: sulfate permease [Betaproteobacteria bacterium]|nr:sulfate permease [Betaproteobacteria bacterium]
MPLKTCFAKIAFHPKLFDCLPGYTRAQFGKDVGAGVTVGVLALPLAMAFAIASGVSPTAGIWTAIIAGFIVSFLGGSRVQIGGPTGAFIPIVYGIVALYGFSNLLIATMLAGIFLLAMGLFRMGQLIRFIPVAVVTGFTNGIAIVIFMAQLKDFMGLSIEAMPADFFGKIRVLSDSLHLLHWPTLALSLTALVFLIFYNRLAQTAALGFLRRMPGPLTVLALGTSVAALFNLPVETIGSRFGGIPQELPAFSFPQISLETLELLISPAIAIALLGAIESLLSARVADANMDDRHDPNQELIAQGIANLVAPLFGGFAATGAIARTATNVRSGGRTPVSGMVHALVLLAIVLLFAPLASHIPLAVLSAIVIMVSVHMLDLEGFRKLRLFSSNYRVVMLATFLVTIVFGLTIAVELGMVLACLFFIYRISSLTRIEVVPLVRALPVHFDTEGKPRVSAWRIHGALFFGAANKLETLTETLADNTKILILDAQSLIQIDSSGLDALEALHEKLVKRGATLFITGLHNQPKETLERVGFLARVGQENLSSNIIFALREAEYRLTQEGDATQ